MAVIHWRRRRFRFAGNLNWFAYWALVINNKYIGNYLNAPQWLKKRIKRKNG